MAALHLAWYAFINLVDLLESCCVLISLFSSVLYTSVIAPFVLLVAFVYYLGKIYALLQWGGIWADLV